MIERALKERLVALSGKYPFVALTGPRQSGKTTLAQMAFPDYRIVSLEDWDIRMFAENDPRGFIATYPHGVMRHRSAGHGSMSEFGVKLDVECLILRHFSTFNVANRRNATDIALRLSPGTRKRPPRFAPGRPLHSKD